MRRTLRGVVVPPGGDGVDVVSAALAAALAGGPPIAPVASAAAARTLAALRPDDPDAPLEDDDVAVVVTTSGSTGQPRGVLLTAAALTAAAAAAAQAGGGGAHWLCALPVTSVAGLMVLVRARDAGTSPVAWPGLAGAATFEAASFAPAAREVLARRDADGTAAATSMVPTQLARLCDDGGEGLALLAGFDAVLVGAAALPAPLRARAEAAGVRVVSTYGATETCGGVVWDGRPLPGVRLRLDTDGGDSPTTGADAPATGTGLWVGGPTVAAGYRLDPAGTGAAFRDGWWRSGDLARFEGDRLVVLGRDDDVVKVGGVKVALGAVERVVRDVPGVLDAAVVAVPDVAWGQAPVAVVVAGHDADPATLAPAVVAAVRDALGAPAAPRAVRFRTSIPLLPNGKPDRRALAAAP